MARAGVRLATGQAAVQAAIVASLHCADNQDLLAPLLAHMVTREAFTSGPPPPVHLHGSLVLQQLLLFTKPIKVVRSLLALPSAQLAALLSDPRGCHISDTFLTSLHVGEKSREGLVRALRGELVGLACSKHGSRTVDALWQHSSPKLRRAMVEELAPRTDVLNSNKFGKFVATKCLLAVYRRSKEDWRKVVEREGRVEDLFTDILGDQAKKIKKTKRKTEDKTKEDEKEAVPEKIAKTEVTTADVDEWLKDDSKPDSKPVEKVKKKKKAKAKSYLDDL